ncbi:MAG: IPExxxVDY family protein [Brumimicrobium sp.]
MAKHTLKLEDDYDFDLIGLCSHHSDYRLCWALNEHLELNLSKAEEPFMVSGKKGEVISSHSFYEWEDEDNLTTYFLIKNKNNSQYLIPEKAQIDYFLVIQEAEVIDIDNFLIRIKEISSILTAFIFDPYDLKSSNKLIF